jgi:DNA-binding SARP family transcriptional activator
LAPALCLYLFGAPRLERNGVPVTTDTRKAIALLAYLAVTGRAHTRDTLATLLWGDADEQHARGALRRTLSVLRTGAGDAVVTTSGDAVRAGPEVWCDVVAFRAGLRGESAGLAAALGAFRGPFMSGFSLRDSPDFEEWQFLEGQALDRELSEALSKLVRELEARDDYTGALEHARRLLSLDTLNEEAHRLLMTLYASSGDLAAALRQYRECVRILEQELGVQPLSETTELYHALRENRLQAPRVQAGAPASRAAALVEPARPNPGRPRPLVGRSKEWQTLAGAYEAGGGFCVALEGEAGIGKTRLAEELLEYARGKGAAVGAGKCFEGESGVSYAVVVQVLRELLRQAPCAEPLSRVAPAVRAEVARLLPELAQAGVAGVTETPGDPGAGVRFRESLSEFLTGLCPRDTPAVLFFDDLHWVDAASLDFLAYFVRRLAGRPVFLLLAWRTDGSPEVERLRMLLAEASRNQRGLLLPLHRLSLAEVVQLALDRDAGDLATRQALAEQIYGDSEGVPLFVEAYLDAAVAGRAVTSAGLPPTIRDLLVARLAPLSDTERQLLQAGAVLGRSFDLDVLQGTSGRSTEETLSGLEDLVVRGLIHEVTTRGPGIVYDFDHDKLRGFIYETTSAGRRRLLHERAARAWTTIGSRRRAAEGTAALAAHHFELAGQDAEAAIQHAAAARQAERVYANADAIGHFQAALELGYQDQAELHEAIGDLEVLRGNYARALAAYEAAAARLPDGAAQLDHKLANVYVRLGAWQAAESYYATADQGLRDGSFEARARLFADWAFAAHQRGAPDRALDLAHQALDLAEVTKDRRVLAQAYNVLGVLQRSRADLAGAVASLEQSCVLAEKLGDAGEHVAALNNLALAVAENGDEPRAEGLLRTALQEAMRRGDRHREAALRNNLADLLHVEGREEEAMAELKQAVGLFAEIGVQSGEGRAEIWKLTEW